MTNEELDRIMAQADDRLDAMKDKLIFQGQEIERLKEQSNNYAKRIINAIEYIKRNGYSDISNSYDELYNGQIEELVEILEGADKE